LKNTPSRAMAKYTRGAVSMLWLRNPTADTAIPTAINRPPRSPSARRITSDAGVLVAASPSIPSTRMQT
jgi:hypothetical protein